MRPAGVTPRLRGSCGRDQRHRSLGRSMDSEKRAGLDPQASRAAPCPPLTSLGVGPLNGLPWDQ